jgi:hypothetical protein
MTEMNGASTVEAKLAFERTASSHGVHIQHYHADNGLFDTKVFKASIQSVNQTLSFCGVNAHHQNGKAENRIKDVTTGARTSLLHAAHSWPKVVNAALWSAAIKHYVNLRNAMPTRFIAGVKRGRTIGPSTFDHLPTSRFSGTEVESNFDHYHAFGSPVYVLKNALQAMNPHNKWEDRSRVGLYLCQSPSHASNVPLVLNTQSANVSPQFHCIYDDDFSTCTQDAQFRSLWQHKAKIQQSLDIDYNPPGRPIHALRPALDPEPAATLAPRFIHAWDAPVVEGDANEPEPVAVPLQPPNDKPEPIVPVIPLAPVEPEPAVITRSGRRVNRPRRLIETIASLAFLHTFSSVPAENTALLVLQPDVEAYAEPHPFAMYLEDIFTFVASSDLDTMTMQEALAQPDREQFIKAMSKELQDHVNRCHWKIVPLKSVPTHKVPIPMVWSMKRKRNPVGDIIKWKARLCAGGHKSLEFVDYWNMYSPVVSWSTVRLMIVMALLNDWHMRSIDFVLAFPQAPIQTDIYMRPPKVPFGFTIPDLPSIKDRFHNVYKLLRNLYGLKDAGRTWFNFLKKGLLQCGWKESVIDGCMFTKDGIILVVYVDDAILISPYKSLITKEIKSLQEDYDLTDDGELEDYLGTRFVRHPGGAIELTQPKMIERVLRIVGLDPESSRVKLHDTPASDQKILDKDPDGLPRVQEWNYRSAVGCVSYI